MITHFIVSVGASVIGNYRRATGQPVDVSYPSGLIAGDICPAAGFPPPALFCEGYPAMKAVFNNPENQGAEAHTIQKILRSNNLDAAGCRYHLITTDTASGLFCASFLAHAVLGHDLTTVYIPKGLGSADDAHFSGRGLPALLSCVAGILDAVEDAGDAAVIVPTGGYKVIVPYLTIASILYKRPAYYIYEGARSLIELPAPPLGVDTAEFRSALVLLENIVGTDMARAAPYYLSLPKSFRHLLLVDDGGRFRYTAFGMRLKSMFMGQSGVTLLRARAEENSLIPHLDGYRDTFIQIARLGDTIWLGDKAPEMADHARHHHTNLFAYAELLLLPIFKDDPSFLSPEELFLFLCMVYLHDCGHSLSALPGPAGVVPLLGTEIRNYHNLLGFIRLNDPVFHQALARQGLILDPALLEAVSRVSLYHRKKMPLLSGIYTGPGGHRFGPLRDLSVNIGGVVITGERLGLLVSLFRIVDGMDKQVGRAGDAVEISMKAEAVLADLPHLWDRVRRFESMMADLPPAVQAVSDSLIDEISVEYGLKEKAAGTNDGPDHAAPCLGCAHNGCEFVCQSPFDFEDIARYTQLGRMLEQEGVRHHLPLAWEYINTRTAFFFHALQPSYYYSDLLLGMPRVTHSLVDGYRRITIEYPGNDDVPGTRMRINQVWAAITDWIAVHVPDEAPEKRVLNARLATSRQVVMGVRDEYCGKKYSEVAALLDAVGIGVLFRHDGRPVPCWR